MGLMAFEHLLIASLMFVDHINRRATPIRGNNLSYLPSRDLKLFPDYVQQSSKRVAGPGFRDVRETRSGVSAAISNGYVVVLTKLPVGLLENIRLIINFIVTRVGK